MNSVGRLRVLLVLALAACATLPVATTSSMLATAASTLFESTPFILAGLALGRITRGRGAFVALCSCGCGTGPSARSLPAAIATAATFGPVVAAARFTAAWLVSRLLSRREIVPRGADPLLTQIGALLPAAAGAAIVMHVFSAIDAARMAPLFQCAFGALLAFAGAPCGLGAVALAGALRGRSLPAAIAFLAVAGIADARALRRPSRSIRAGCCADTVPSGHDAFAYAVAATAFAAVAARGGDALVHPVLAAPLGACALTCAAFAIRFRAHSDRRARTAPCVMLAGALIGAPAPAYHATETTMTALFPGERLIFSGALVRGGDRAAVVRYAITCCRADATPVAVRLTRGIGVPNGSWVRVEGTVERCGEELGLAPERVERVAPPSDPFLYR